MVLLIVCGGELSMGLKGRVFACYEEMIGRLLY